MNIFDKRPLSLILCIALCGFVIFSIGSLAVKLSVLLAALILSLLYFALSSKGRRATVIIAAAFGLVLASLFSYIYFDLWFHAEERFNTEVSVVGCVEEVNEGEYYDTLVIKTDNVNDKPFTKYRLLLRLKNGADRRYTVGDVLSFDATLAGFDESSSYVPATYYYSKGIHAEATNIENINLLSEGKTTLRSLLSHLREHIRRYAVMISDENAGTLFTALFIGERDALSGKTLLDFKRIGITHLLALSGLHLSIIALSLGKILLLLGIAKKQRYALTVIFVIIYMAFTSFSVSVTRAGVMLIIAALLFLFAHGNDRLTSLTVSVLLICIATPYAIYDTALWLSAFSTFGIIAFGEIIEKKKKPNGIAASLGWWFCTSLLSSVFAIAATFFITEFKFDGISVIAPISTLVFSFLVKIIIYIGILTLMLGAFLPIGRLLSLVVTGTFELSSFLSSANWIYASTDYLLLKITVIAFVLIFYALLCLKLKRKGQITAVTTLLFVLIFTESAILGYCTRTDDGIIYSSESKSDVMLLKSDSEVCLINSSGYSKNQSYDTLKLLEIEKITHIDYYYLTHYSYNVEDSTENILKSIYVESIYIPSPKCDEETAMLYTLISQAEKYDTEVILMSEDIQIHVGELIISHEYSAPYGESSVNIFRIYKDEQIITYLSSGALLIPEEVYPVSNNISASDTVIFGSHGRKYSDKLYLDTYFDRLCEIINCSQNLIFTQDVYAEYTENGCKIHSHPSYMKLCYYD